MSFSRVKKTNQFGDNKIMNQFKNKKITKTVNGQEDTKVEVKPVLVDAQQETEITLDPPFLTVDEYSPMKQRLYRGAINQILDSYKQSDITIDLPTSKISAPAGQLEDYKFSVNLEQVINLAKAKYHEICQDIQSSSNIPFKVSRKGTELTVGFNNPVKIVESLDIDNNTGNIELPYVSIPSYASDALLIVFGFKDSNDPESIDLITKKAQLY